MDNTASVMYDLKQDLDARRIKSLQDSEARETHHIAMDKLRRAEEVSLLSWFSSKCKPVIMKLAPEIQLHSCYVLPLQGMNPYVASSVDHIHQFCDHVGVTDRYTGFRNNLNRGTRDPVRLGYSWLDNKAKNSYNGSLNVGWRPASSSNLAPRESLPKLDSRQFSAPAVTRSLGECVRHFSCYSYYVLQIQR